MHLCRYPGCADMTAMGSPWCDDHRPAMAQAERDRLDSLPNMEAWYNSAKWRNLRAVVIAEQGGLCHRCGACKSLHVHHIRQPRGSQAAFFDRGNLVALCRSCHEGTYHGGSH